MAWESKTRLFGIPLISAGFFAKGFIAIGFSGIGVITIAQFGAGIISITQFGFGIFALSQFAVGLVCVAQMALGIIFSYGQFALGFISTGATAIGYYSIPSSFDIVQNLPLLLQKVKQDPIPLAIWIFLWSGIMGYIYSAREKFTRSMKLVDLFRKTIRHSDEKVRLRALAGITDQDELSEMIQHDQSQYIKRTALKRINDEAILLKLLQDESLRTIHQDIMKKISGQEPIARYAIATSNRDMINKVMGRIDREDLLYLIAEEALLPAMKISALKKIKRPDQDRFSRLACSENNPAVIHELLLSIKEEDKLRQIISDAVSSEARVIAITNLRDFDQDKILAIIEKESSLQVCESLIRKINSDPLLIRIITGNLHSGIRKAAIEQIKDKKALSAVLESGISPATASLIRDRLNELKPIYYALKMEMGCPFCSQPVIINGPMKNILCSSCLSEIDLSRKFWRTARQSGFGLTRMLTSNIVIEKSGLHPACLKCGAPLETDDVPKGHSAPLRCPSCGAANSTFPVPQWLGWSKNADQLFCADEEGEDYSGEVDMKPVSISCIKCGGPLEITSETPRNATCSYCNTLQYLPDPLWLSLHPAKKKHLWYIRCDFRERDRFEKLKRG